MQASLEDGLNFHKRDSMNRRTLNFALALVSMILLGSTRAHAERTRDVCGPVDLIGVTDMIYDVCGSGGGTAVLYCYSDGSVRIHSITCAN